MGKVEREEEEEEDEKEGGTTVMKMVPAFVSGLLGGFNLDFIRFGLGSVFFFFWFISYRINSYQISGLNTTDNN